MFSTDVILESFRALVLLFLVVYLWKLGQRKHFIVTSGWRFIQTGFLLILFGSFLDITDNFENLNRFVVIGDTETEAFLEKVVGYLAGFTLLTIGLVRWGPSVEKLMAEKARREASEQEYTRDTRLKQYFLETTQEGYWHIGPDGVTVDVNPAFCQILDRKREQIIGESYLNFVDVENAEKLETILADKTRGKGGSHEIQLLRPDGSAVPCLNNATPVTDIDGTQAGTIGMWTDLTEQKRMEETLRRSQALEAAGQLTGGIAHDFNNLLGVIMGSLQITRDLNAENAPAVKWIDKALNGARRGAELTQSLLRFSRQDELGSKVLSINDLIEEMKDLLQKSLTRKIEMHIDLEPDLWLTNISAGDFTDTLTNLTLNAHDAMPRGGRLHIATRNVELGDDHAFMNSEARPGYFVCLEIHDTGTGIEPEHLKKLFDPFFTTKGPGGGTGLGLSMVYRFVRRAGGDITVDSDSGGTTFEIYLPRAKQLRPVSQAKKGNPLANLSGQETILIVDDEAHLTEIAEQHLSKLGYKTICTNKTAEALYLMMNDGSIDLLFSDVVMPLGMNGFELAKTGMGANPKLKALLTSGFSNRETLEAEGVDFSDQTVKELSASLLPKPYSQEELAIRVRQVLDGK